MVYINLAGLVKTVSFKKNNGICPACKIETSALDDFEFILNARIGA